MGLECLLVVAHATGRTLVVPPQQHLYLLGKYIGSNSSNSIISLALLLLL